MFTLLGRKPLLCILTAAFLLRGGLATAVQFYLDRTPGRQYIIPGDAEGYWGLSRQIAAGEDFAFYSPPRYVMRMPGFPLFLVLSFGSFWWARILLAAVGTLACGLVYLLGRDLFDRTTGLVAAAAAAVSPTMVGFSVLILSETLFAACLLGSLIVMHRVAAARFSPELEWRAAMWSFAAGMMIAVACYVRPSWLLAAPCFAVVLVGLSTHRKQACLRATLVLVGTLTALSPWIYRNYLVTGHLVVTTLWVGVSLYDGLNPNADGDSDLSFFDRELLLKQMSEYDVDRHYRERAWEFAKGHPGRVLQLAFTKLWRFWKPWPNAQQFRSWWLSAAVAATFLPIFVMAAYGWWQLRDRPWCWLLTVGPILYFSAIHAVFVGSLRYRLPAEYPLYLLAAYGAKCCWKKLRAPQAVG